MTRRLILALLAGAAIVPAARAQDALAAAKARGEVGERPDGLVGAVGTPTAEVRGLVERVNAERMAVYRRIAQRNNAPVEAVQRSAGERLVRETPAGQFYMDAGGRWQRR